MTDYRADIPFDIARRAHEGTSHVPEQRARQEQESYAATLAADFANLERYATTDEKRATLAELFAVYRTGYARRYRDALGARSRCMSAMITGPARFPVERNRKRNATADKRASEADDYRETMLASIRRALTPELQPIMTGDSNAADRLRAKLAALTAERDLEKRANAAIRKAVKALGRETTRTDHLAIVAALDVPEEMRARLVSMVHAFPWVPQYGPNTGAAIRDVEQRLKAVTTAKATPDARTEGTIATVEESAADNRIRITFPSKPDAATRERLKRNGFRWAPSLGVWQAYLNHQTRTAGRNIAGAPPTALDAAATFVAAESTS